MAPRMRNPSGHGDPDSDADEDVVEFSQPGSIVRIKFVDFMQYTESEFLCGPNLNVIIGPNGSGKSSIVNGICLGLAGKPSVLNRANSLAEFVRIGAETASIEVELFHPAQGNLVVFRQFDKNNKSVWKLNGQKSGLREVERTVAELRIQVDNLCQFLPQDKIHDFSTLNNKGLLDSTVDAVGDMDLKTQHSELKQLQKTVGEGQDLYERKKQMLEEKTEECRRLEEDVKAFEEKKEVEAKIVLANGKLAWSRYKEVKKVGRETESKYREAQENYNKERSRLNPLEEASKEAAARKEMISRKKHSLINNSRDMTGKFRVLKQNIDTSNDRVEDFMDQVENLDRVQEAKQQEIKKLRTTIMEMEQNFASLQDDASIGPKLQEAKRKTSIIQEKLDKVVLDNDNLKYEERKLNSDHQHYQQELAKLNDVEKMKMNKLRQWGGDDVFRGLVWLRQNRDMFRGAVYEPFIVSADIKDPRQAMYVESSIQLRDLTAFLFEEATDMNTFMNETRNRLGLKKVNAVKVPRESVSEFSLPTPSGDLRSLGFVSTVKDLVTAPDQVMSYMCKQYGLHRIPVFSEEANRHHQRIENLGFTKFFVGNKIQTISGSRYSRAKTTLTKEIRPRGQLEISKDVEKESNINEELSKIKGRAQELSMRSSAYQEQIQEMQISLEAARREQTELEKRKNYRASHGAKIEAQKRLLRQRLAEENSPQGRAALDAKIREQINQQVAFNKQLQVVVRDHSRLQVEMELCTISLQPLDEIIQRKQLEMSQAEETLRDLRSAVDDLLKETEEAKSIMKTVLREAIEETGRGKQDEPPAGLREKWEENKLPSGADHIETLINELQAKAECMDNIDKRIIKEYRALKENIRELEQDIKLRDAARGENEEKMTRLKNSWLQSLEALIERINANFSNYFASMGFAGEVGLRRGGHENDFENYGICIRVKFRDDEPLQELTGSRQSGGERSVSTALYMMALQELTSVPFRCVDEINQGMDARNEKLVFEMLVRTSCHVTSSQYFLLTPKLLTGLHFSPRMNLLIVYNGPAMCNYKDWNMEDFEKKMLE